MKRSKTLYVTMSMGLALFPLSAGELEPGQAKRLESIRCNNLIYAKGKTSICFADQFLATTAKETGLEIEPKFKSVKLSSEALFDSPFTVISGEGSFRFSKAERENIRRYLECGGFLLASPGCSDAEWDKCFRAEWKALFPETPLKKIPMTHEIFSLFYDLPTLTLRGGGRTLVEGMVKDGRLALIYSTEGLNDAGNAKGCCCCGGSQIRESEKVNVNILLHALLN